MKRFVEDYEFDPKDDGGPIGTVIVVLFIVIIFVIILNAIFG